MTKKCFQVYNGIHKSVWNSISDIWGSKGLASTMFDDCSGHFRVQDLSMDSRSNGFLADHIRQRASPLRLDFLSPIGRRYPLCWIGEACGYSTSKFRWGHQHWSSVFREAFKFLDLHEALTDLLPDIAMIIQSKFLDSINTVYIDHCQACQRLFDKFNLIVVWECHSHTIIHSINFKYEPNGCRIRSLNSFKNREK